jgi:hypothetical protein
VEAIPTSEGGALPGAKPRVLRLPDSVARKVTEQAGPDAAALAEIATSSAYGAPQAPLPRRAKGADTRRPDDGEPPQRVALPRGPSIAAPETDAGVRLIGLLAVLVALTAAVTVGAIRARA